MIEATNTFNSQSASRLLSILQSKAGERWGRALEELEGKRLQVEGSFPQFAVTNKSGTRYDVTLDEEEREAALVVERAIYGKDTENLFHESFQTWNKTRDAAIN